VWPSQWSANVTSWVYRDFTNASVVASGRFYYDAVGGHSRSDWTPYINGKDATQVWIADLTTGKSNYYVKSGPLCISFPITDPGIPSKPAVGVERPDWMAHCQAAGFAAYQSRERIEVDGAHEWTDHWSCHVDDIDADQAITFQNWHSLGLGATLRGLPLRVTGGNSAPDSQKGSPRLSTVWYSNFSVGPNSSSPSLFDKPSFFCIPVAAEKSKAALGHTPTAAHVFDSSFHQRAQSLLEDVHASAQAADLRRASTKVPRAAYKGHDFGSMGATLNRALQRMPGVEQTRPCADFSASELRDLLADALYPAAAPALLQVYDGAADNRRRVERSAAELRARWTEVDAHARAASLTDMHRDGLCHKAVMWFVHHLPADARASIGPRLVLPLLPVEQHDVPAEGSHSAATVYAEYSNSTSCAACHFV